MISETTLAQLAEVAAISAGFIAAIVAYMITTEEYKRFVKYFLVSVLFFVASSVLFVGLASHTLQSFLLDYLAVDPTVISDLSIAIFTLGWIYVSAVFIVASFQVEVVGLRASLPDTLRWFIQSKIKGEFKESIKKKTVKIKFLDKVIQAEVKRGLCILVISRLQNYMRNFAFQFLAEGLSTDEYGIYVSTNVPYHVINDALRNIPVTQQRLFVIDCYSPLFGFGEKPIIGKPARLNAKNIKTLHQNIRKIRKKIGLEKDYNKVRIIYDSIDLMKFSVNETDVIRYLYHSVPIEKELGWITIFLCGEGEKETAIGRFLSFMADCTIVMEEKSVKDERKVYLKIIDMEKVCKWDSCEHECTIVSDVPCCYMAVD